ncbi:MAG TPA: hypothetical protein VLF93_05005 [Candidatus Saccharimonadales bacterium]|nr:hypothetical protein [Candidatus Saccharimonadales bacterium]
MKIITNLIKLTPVLFLLPFADLPAYFALSFLLFVLASIVFLPILIFGLLIKLIFQFGDYTTILWLHSGNDTKLIAVITIIGVVLAAFTALPVSVSIFKKIRKYSWSQLEKNNIHHRRKDVTSTK